MYAVDIQNNVSTERKREKKLLKAYLARSKLSVILINFQTS